ncbi:methionyl-tRNA formyltransferase [Planotetraspora phitsanulokensis]|uniref:methionyl-tRNA formyltransferase n=1 Tax=Planotetraspora phitsanulokensis TaxID=575192 RepID=UPI00195019DF|nr:formyltransferase family protein [Planotetraspora phitsanulokensis]
MHAYLPGYRLVADWAERHGHEIVLVVTPPTGANQRYDKNATPFVLDLPRDANVLVTGQLRTIAAPVIDSLQPDLVISAAFPRLIPAEILGVPKYGAFNLHPSPLPAGRGPNPGRLIYEGATTVGAALHRTERDFDTGAVLSRRERPLPDDLDGPALGRLWTEMLAECLEEGAARAVAGDPGIPQDPSKASEAPFYTDAERLIDLTEPVATIRRRVAALNVTAPQARIRLDGSEETVVNAYGVPADRPSSPGTVLERHPDGWTVQAGDRPLRILTA